MRLGTCAILGLVLAGSACAQTKQESLIDALRERLQTAEAVAKAKHNSGAPVEDKVRERQVILDAVHQGVSMGLGAEEVLWFFRHQIEASKIAQRAFLDEWKNRGAFDSVPDLVKEIRPKLDRLTTILLHEIKARSHVPAKAEWMGPPGKEYRLAWQVALEPAYRSDKKPRNRIVRHVGRPAASPLR